MKFDIPRELIQAIKDSKHITVLTGAGISAESGIPTFREAQTGLWTQYDPEDLATPQAFSANPKLVWRWYRWRKEIISRAAPNQGHLALAHMEAIVTQLSSFFTLITQNVDGIHQRAGSRNIIELHGNINRTRCSNCGSVVDDDQYTDDESPRCLHCNGLLRPDVVWFGENLPEFELQSSWEAAQKCDLFLSIGTSSLVQPAASLPIIALQNSASVIEINPNITPLTTYVTYSLQGPSGQTLPQLIRAVWPTRW